MRAWPFLVGAGILAVFASAVVLWREGAWKAEDAREKVHLLDYLPHLRSLLDFEKLGASVESETVDDITIRSEQPGACAKVKSIVDGTRKPPGYTPRCFEGARQIW